jgi:hypothetical protein
MHGWIRYVQETCGQIRAATKIFFLVGDGIEELNWFIGKHDYPPTFE